MKIKNEFIIQPLHSTWGIKIGVRVSWSAGVCGGELLRARIFWAKKEG
jgi:hypothetical protein